jgi:hypothetical protein
MRLRHTGGFCAGGKAVSNNLDSQIERIGKMLKLGYAVGYRRAVEDIIDFLEMIDRDDDDSDAGEAASIAFNSGDTRRSMNDRLRDRTTAIVRHMRALIPAESEPS